MVQLMRVMFAKKKLILGKLSLAAALLFLLYQTENFAQRLVFSGEKQRVSQLQQTADELAAPLFTQRHLLLWSNDRHPAPTEDARHLLEPLGVRILQHDLSRYCQHFNVCEERKRLKVVNTDNMINLDSSLIYRFYNAYKHDPTMKSVDAFLCYDPPSICELFEPFNKSLIIIASNRYYVKRQSKRMWERWNENLILYASSAKHFIGANNVYDVHYMRYFTGIEPTLLQSFADYTETKYTATLPGYLVSKRPPDNKFVGLFVGHYRAICKKAPNASACPLLISIKERYPKYSYSDLAAHQGIVHVPYQVSTMSIFEQYRMNIPLFFPSQKLLLKWTIDSFVLRNRALPFGQRDTRRYSFIPPHPSQKHVPNPNDNYDVRGLKYWIQFCDYYTLPHITYFESVAHLAALLRDLTAKDLWTISQKMKAYNARSRHKILKTWSQVLQNVASYSPNQPS